jgi:hypothetical protein
MHTAEKRGFTMAAPSRGWLVDPFRVDMYGEE